MSSLPRVQLRGQLQLDQRFVEPPAGVEPPAARVVVLRGAQLRMLESLPRGAVVGIGLQRPGVFDDRAVVVLAARRSLRTGALDVAQPESADCQEQSEEGIA